ncbi:cytochrome P450 [Roridomyces roridus]|uniref:Cytochrome P450 n=1 Tax=Roridomyces roridus TaxID=1738132 RepID=A0AAD7BC77_9AGAR|nr:cytochrome P450 [Roridomyces roridus]
MFLNPLPSHFTIPVPNTPRNWLYLLVLCYALSRLLRRSYTRARSPLRDIPGPPAESWFTGNLGQLFTAKGLPFHHSLVSQYGGLVKVHGFFGDEQLYISDPRALQSILVKEQDAFEETGVFVETNKVIFGPGLVSTTGAFHKRQRKLTLPIFSLNNLRELVPTLYDVADRLSDVLARETQAADVLDMSEWMSRASLEAAGQAILGYSFDPLDSRVNNAYTQAIRELIPTIFKLSLIRQLAPFLVRLGPAWLRRLLVNCTPIPAVQRLKEMSDVMHASAVAILEKARQGLRDADAGGDRQGKGKAKDITSLLLRANENAGDAEQMSDAELTGQMTVMIFGAQDTSTSALTRILYMLATRPDVQDRIRSEIKQMQLQDGGERLTVEQMNALPWLDAVIKETLRLYPPVPFVRRTAVEERIIPYLLPSGAEDAVRIPRGTTLFLGIAGANRMKCVWGEDAADWKPERWLGIGVGERGRGEKERLPGVYSGMMSFLGGKRACIGYKFAEIEIKIFLTTLLRRFEFSTTGTQGNEIVWNLSQIISPSVRVVRDGKVCEEKGLPLRVRMVTD